MCVCTHERACVCCYLQIVFLYVTMGTFYASALFQNAFNRVTYSCIKTEKYACVQTRVSSVHQQALQLIRPHKPCHNRWDGGWAWRGGERTQVQISKKNLIYPQKQEQKARLSRITRYLNCGINKTKQDHVFVVSCVFMCGTSNCLFMFWVLCWMVSNCLLFFMCWGFFFPAPHCTPQGA